ncbi:coagulation factor XI-like [Pleurodeles waltl]|uniref:coagulation factor XI-like n=1 Tax=Pleurodeles waltl TaxID=8319 RepID=UPI003709A3B7
MKYFILLQVFLVCATANEDATLLENVDFPGNDIERILAPDAECCQVYCTAHFNCRFFTFVLRHPDIPSYSCFLKRTDNGLPVRRTTLQNAVSGFRLSTTDPEKHSCFTKTYQDVDFLGSDIRALVRENPTECQDACSESLDCQFFTYVTENYNLAPHLRKMCFQKFATNLPSPPVINILEGVVSGFSPRDCFDQNACGATCTEYLLPDVDFSGNDFEQVLAPDAEYCQLICSNHPRCQYFTYLTSDWTTDNRKFFCYLKSSATLMPSITPLSNVISGFSLRSFGDKSTCSDHMFKGLDFPGNDRGVMKAESHLQCQEFCKEDPFCLFFTYVEDTFSNVAQRKDCYLKSLIALRKPPQINELKDVVSGFSRPQTEDPLTV